LLNSLQAVEPKGECSQGALMRAPLARNEVRKCFAERKRRVWERKFPFVL